MTPEGCGPLGAASWPEWVGGWEPEQWAWGTLPAAFGLGSWGLKLKLKAKVQPQLEQRPPPPFWSLHFSPSGARPSEPRGKAFWKLLEPLQNTLDNKMGWSRALGAGPPHHVAIASWLTLAGRPKANLGGGAKQGWEGDTTQMDTLTGEQGPWMQWLLRAA